MNAAAGKQVWGRQTEQANDPNLRQITKLEQKLKLGKMLFADTTILNESERKVSTLVSLKQPMNDKFIVGLEVFYTSDDVGSLSDEEFTFAELEGAKTFIYRKTGLRFDQMYLNEQNRKYRRG